RSAHPPRLVTKLDGVVDDPLLLASDLLGRLGLVTLVLLPIRGPLVGLGLPELASGERLQLGDLLGRQRHPVALVRARLLVRAVRVVRVVLVLLGLVATLIVLRGLVVVGARIPVARSASIHASVAVAVAVLFGCGDQLRGDRGEGLERRELFGSEFHVGLLVGRYLMPVRIQAQ